MNYNISEDTYRLLHSSCEWAGKLGMNNTDESCILFVAVNELKDVIPDSEPIRLDISLISDELNNQYKEEIQKVITDAPAPPLSPEAERIARLTVLEGALHPEIAIIPSALLLCAILHDRENKAKSYLFDHHMSYEKLTKGIIEWQRVVSPKSVSKEEQTSAELTEREGEDSLIPAGMSGGSAASTESVIAQKEKSGTPVTDSFGTDLTALALRGGLDPVIGREKEIERLMQILSRRKKNNPIIIGDPGVGKSTLVEGLASRIVSRRVPMQLQNKRIVSLDMASVVAGTQYRGQFEERLKRLISELKSHPEIILFIDEIHTIIGAGSTPGSLDAANILKPALARGEMQCIGATTTSEFKKTIEKDGALDRRFQKIQLPPTTADETIEIVRRLQARYEEHHHVSYTDEAIEACVTLTELYVSDRQFPDKAIDALDEAGSRARLASGITPKAVEEMEKEVRRLTEEKVAAAAAQDYERASVLRDRAKRMEKECKAMIEAWQRETERTPAVVSREDVASVVSMMSGVPAGRVAADERKRLGEMKADLSRKVLSQDKAIARLSRAISRSRLGLKGHDRPIGTFLFVGPTGVGKTHLVKCLAEWMFGTKEALIRIDMSEYGEKYSVSRLLGAPPGYVGYEEGGQLTERVRRHPYSVVLLDEIEKAHPDVFNTLLQVMDEGRLTESGGDTVDFRHTIIVMTSNTGTRRLGEFGAGIGFSVGTTPTASEAENIIMKAIKKQFAPEFLNRLDDIVMFNPLTAEDAARIFDIEIVGLIERLAENGCQIKISPEAKELTVKKGFDPQYGARSLKRAIQTYLEDALCDYLIDRPGLHDLTLNVENDKIIITDNLQQNDI